MVMPLNMLSLPVELWISYKLDSSSIIPQQLYRIINPMSEIKIL